MQVSTDFRALSVADILDTVNANAANQVKVAAIRDSLLAVAVWHSVKDGQITPGLQIAAKFKGNARADAISYLTRYGNFKFSKKLGLSYSKEKAKGQFGIVAADKLFEDLPTMDVAFPKMEREWKDITLVQLLKMVENKVEAVQEHGKQVLMSDEDKEILTIIQKRVKTA